MDGILVQRADKVAFMGVPTSISESISATVSGGGITKAIVDADTFKGKVSNKLGDYVFNYNGTDWSLKSATVVLTEYGITTQGTAKNGDSITVNYVGATQKIIYHRMQGFTDMSKSLNPKEYSRQYVTQGTAKNGDSITVNYVGATQKIIYHRMQGFTDMSKSLNPKEYSRQYVDEAFEQTDVVGFSPSIAYSFDQYKGNAVHDDLVQLSDNEAVGTSAVRTIVIVDFTKPTDKDGEYKATSRDFSVIPDSEGGSMDAYTYSGNFKVKGNKVDGTATTNDDWLTLEFVKA